MTVNNRICKGKMDASSNLAGSTNASVKRRGIFVYLLNRKTEKTYDIPYFRIALDDIHGF